MLYFLDQGRETRRDREGDAWTCHEGHTGKITRIGYRDEELGSVPEGANLGLGCGNPVALASLKEGENYPIELTANDSGAKAIIEDFNPALEGKMLLSLLLLTLL
jgi:hypothetical protein